MSRHLNNEGQECKTGHIKERILPRKRRVNSKGG
jgi:hypothetical protein